MNPSYTGNGSAASIGRETIDCRYVDSFTICSIEEPMPICALGRCGCSARCAVDEGGESLIRAEMGQMNLSARGYHRVLKPARTIADLAGCEQIQASHLAEALQYRPMTMMV